jgi:hypothetical protein
MTAETVSAMRLCEKKYAEQAVTRHTVAIAPRVPLGHQRVDAGRSPSLEICTIALAGMLAQKVSKPASGSPNAEQISAAIPSTVMGATKGSASRFAATE